MATEDIRFELVQGLAEQSSQDPAALAATLGVPVDDMADVLPQLLKERSWRRRSKRRRDGNDRVFSATVTRPSGPDAEVFAGVHSSPADDVVYALRFGVAPVESWWPPAAAPAPTGAVPRDLLERVADLNDAYFDHEDEPNYRPGETIDLGWDREAEFGNWLENPEWARDCRRVRALCMPDAPWWSQVKETLLGAAAGIVEDEDDDQAVRAAVVEILTDDSEWVLHAVGALPDGYRFTAWVPLSSIEHAGLALVTGPNGEEGLAEYSPV